MNAQIILLIIFAVILGIFLCLCYSFHKNEAWARSRNKIGAIFMSITGFSLFLWGLETKYVIRTTLGISLLLASASNLSDYIKHELLSRILEVLFTASSIATILYGYVTTKNVIFGVITLFILVTLLFGLMFSYIIPKIYKHSDLG